MSVFLLEYCIFAMNVWLQNCKLLIIHGLPGNDLLCVCMSKICESSWELSSSSSWNVKMERIPMSVWIMIIVKVAMRMQQKPTISQHKFHVCECALAPEQCIWQRQLGIRYASDIWHMCENIAPSLFATTTFHCRQHADC